MLVVGRQRPVQRGDRPPVVQGDDLVRPRGQHRLDGQHHPHPEGHAEAGAAHIRHLRLLVDVTADAVAHQVTDDRETAVSDGVHHGRPDVPDVIAGPSRRHRRPERLLRHRHEAGRFRADFADRERVRRVGAPALPLHAHVDRHDVTVSQRPHGRYPVHHLGVDADAGTAGEAVEALERGGGAVVRTHEVVDEAVERGGGHPGTHPGLDLRKQGGDDVAARRDRTDLVGRFEVHQGARLPAH